MAKRWRTMHKRAYIHAIDIFFCDASLDLEEALLPESPMFLPEYAEHFVASCGWGGDVSIQQAWLRKGVTGYYNKYTNVITIDSRIAHPDVVRWRILCHELAHHWMCEEVSSKGPHHNKRFCNLLAQVIEAFQKFIDENHN